MVRRSWHNADVVLLVSTYDLGHQPFGLASAAASLRAAGLEATCADASRERLTDDAITRASVVAFFLPMHTATRLALSVIERVRALNPAARLIAYGLYAPLNAELLRERGCDAIIGGEFEDQLVAAVRDGSNAGVTARTSVETGGPERRVFGEVPRVRFAVPDRSGLPPLERYAALRKNGERVTAGYTEASRGCKHHCRHCPIVPVYDGRFRIVPLDNVMADVGAQVAAGARHITFGDPDFFNGIRHAMAVVDRFATNYPDLTYDVTIKVEHLLRHSEMLPRLRDTGCLFVTTAVEAVDDRVLGFLEKGHTRADFERVAEHMKTIGLPLSPTFVAFTPWTTLEGYCDLLQTIDRLALAPHVAPVQLAIRLLVTEGSRLHDLAEIRDVIQPFHPRSLTYPWAHPDPRVDELHRQVEQAVGVPLAAPRSEVFARVWALAHESAGQPDRHPRSLLAQAPGIPYLDEPWYCCAEPTLEQVRLI
jgi:radical SAM superfamily enzyme YgiQ (UPF0313 family)